MLNNARTSVPDDTLCPAARAERMVGDRATVLILRELFMGNRRFEHIQAQAELTPQMLTARLKKMEADGLVERRSYSVRPPRHEYVLTPMGQAFHPVLMALRAWGETWLKGEGEPRAIHYRHEPCGEDPGLGSTCRNCGQALRREDMTATFDETYAAEREARWANFKAG